MSFRKIIFWLHLIAGCLAGLVILVMALTGVILAFERQMVAKAESVAAPSTGAARLSMATLLNKVREANEDAMPSMITMRSDETAPVVFNFGREKMLWVNPYTGETVGKGSPKVRAFFSFVTDLHRWLAAPNEHRAIGKAVTGGCNLAFLFLVVSGIYLWWPRQWSRPMLKAITRLNFSTSGKARDWNWHNVIGIWSAFPLLVVVSTGVIMSYGWATNLLYRITGNEIPKRMEGREGGRTRSGVDLVDLNFGHFDAMWTEAQKKEPTWKVITLRLPSSVKEPLSFSIDRGNGARPDLRSQLNFNGETGEVISFESYGSNNAGRKLRLWSRWMHTGEAAGLIGQVVAAIASMGAAFLVWTGISLAIHRLIGNRTVSVDVGKQRAVSGEILSK